MDQHNPAHILTDSSPLQLLTELRKIFVESDPHCRICKNYIHTLTEHVRKKHAPRDGQWELGLKKGQDNTDINEESQFVPRRRSQPPAPAQDLLLDSSRRINRVDYTTQFLSSPMAIARHQRKKSNELQNLFFEEQIETTETIGEIEIKEEVEDFVDNQYFEESPFLFMNEQDTLSNPLQEEEEAISQNQDPLLNQSGLEESGFKVVFKLSPLSKEDIGPENHLESEQPNFDHGNIVETKSYSRKGNAKKPIGPYKLNDGNIQCTLCPQKFRTAVTLRRHYQKGHKPDKNTAFPNPAQCKFCAKIYPTTTVLKNHIVKFHKTKVPPYHCKICDVKFKKRSDFTSHFVQYHPDRKAFVCEIKMCKKEFINEALLGYHVLSHTGEKPFSCTICEKKFAYRKKLGYHMMNHTGEKPKVCEICGSSFKLLKQLIVHRRIHTGEAPFMCEICSKCFRSDHALRNHKLYHKGERSHICEYCNKGFITKRNLNTHRKIHTGKKEQVCPTCGKAFEWAYALKGHINRLHSK